MTNPDQPASDKAKSYEVLGIGTPIVDYLIHTSNEYVDSLEGCRGGSMLVDEKAFQKILNDHSPDKVIAGGGAANTVKGLARLGHACALVGKIGQDETGVQFSQNIESHGIVPCLTSISTLPTGRSACLITPDGERTMRTSIGAGAEMQETDLSPALFQNVRLVHIEGFLLTRKNLVEKAMQLAKEAGAAISFDLSSREIVEEYKKPIVELLTHYVDIAFANEEETYILTGMAPERASALLRDLCSIAVIKAGSQGCWAAIKNQQAFHEAFQIEIIDTTGAGDLFASGFLHGFLTDKSLDESLNYGARLASEVIQTLGAEIPEPKWQEIRKSLEQSKKVTP